MTLTAANFVPDGFLDAAVDILDDAGQVKASFNFQESLPSSIAFDGKDNSGKPLPEGNYRARMRANYNNGALAEAVTDPVMLKITPPSVKVTANTKFFSPDGDGSKDWVEFTQLGSEAPAWKGTITSANGSAVKSFEWQGKPDEKARWDGTDDAGKKLPDGEYSYVLAARDEAGNAAASPAIPLVIDTQPATLSVGTDFDAFSPNGDGVRDVLKIEPVLHVGKETEAYTLTVRNSAGAVVRTIKEDKMVPRPLTWDGKDDQGSLVPDGGYSADLEVTYLSGSHPKASTKLFAIDTVFPEAAVQADKLKVQPELGDAEKGITFSQTTSDEDLWTGEVLSPAASTPIFSQTWKGKATDFIWRGTLTDGDMAEAGIYKYRLVAEDRAGNRKVAEIANLEVVTRKPALSVIPSAIGLSPNGDGKFDDITFDLDCRETRGLLGGKLEFFKDGKELVGSIAQDGKAPFPRSVKWDGRDQAGKVLPDGSYSVVFTADYENRKLRAEAPNRILIDTTPPEVKLSSDSLPFSPDNDGRNDTLDVAIDIKDASPVGAWSARILDPSGAEFIGFAGKGDLPAKASWDGISAKGDLVKSAEDYGFDYSVTDALGNTAKGRGSFRRTSSFSRKATSTRSGPPTSSSPRIRRSISSGGRTSASRTPRHWMRSPRC